MVGGHTHHRMVRQLEKLTVINPGTLKHDQDPCIAIADFDADVARFFERATAWELVDEVQLPAPAPG
jgi:predicted phosphodiesterase